jgi:hypothetical protein
MYPLDEKGKYLKAKSVGLPVVPLQPKRQNGYPREETFTLLFKIGSNKPLSEVIIDYTVQFYLTGKINKKIMSVPLKIVKGTVTARG